MTVIQFKFPDGHIAIVPAKAQVRLRHVDHMGVQQWPAKALVTGTYPPSAPYAVWMFVENTGAEHCCSGMVAQLGTMTPDPAPTAAAPAHDTPTAATAVVPVTTEVQASTEPAVVPKVKKPRRGGV